MHRYFLWHFCLIQKVSWSRGVWLSKFPISLSLISISSLFTLWSHSPSSSFSFLHLHSFHNSGFHLSLSSCLGCRAAYVSTSPPPSTPVCSLLFNVKKVVPDFLLSRKDDDSKKNDLERVKKLFCFVVDKFFAVKKRKESEKVNLVLPSRRSYWNFDISSI